MVGNKENRPVSLFIFPVLAFLLCLACSIPVSIGMGDVVESLTLTDEQYYARHPNPAHADLPWIREEIGRMSGVYINEVYDFGLNSEHNHDIMITVVVEGRGEITFYNLNRSSFTGGGPINLVTRWRCPNGSPNLYDINHIGRGGGGPGLEFETLGEVVANYDYIYRELSPHGWESCLPKSP